MAAITKNNKIDDIVQPFYDFWLWLAYEKDAVHFDKKVKSAVNITKIYSNG